MTAPDRRGAVFFDRDGVLNEDHGYVHKVKDFHWIDGARDALRAVQDRGLLAIVVTNQSGVARGYFTEADVAGLHDWMRADLARDGISVAAFYACPYHPDAIVPAYRVNDHPDRKPNPGMILKAMREWNIDPARAMIVGDKPSDIVAGNRAGIGAMLYAGGNLHALLSPRLPALAAR
jgi:D-glycero-D-manno-heptose 1,7-bisphosphate phosphatase